MKVGGKNVAAIAVESALPVAFVEQQEMLIGHCRGRVGGYKISRAIHFMAGIDWPMLAARL